MIKCQVLEQFTLKDFDKLNNIVRNGQKETGKLFTGDIFECDVKMAKYLLGNNDLKRAFVKIIEVIPEKGE